MLLFFKINFLIRSSRISRLNFFQVKKCFLKFSIIDALSKQKILMPENGTHVEDILHLSY